MCSRGGGVVGGAVRKGPWTEQEDTQLAWFVRLLGERRWDFLAQVSGLRRTGKSCRLRWVNYLHPGLKRGRITADEERLILQLHAQWGSRWSRIARRLPGRTDNEIKNYWRTHMRKKAQEEKIARKKITAAAAASSSSLTTTSSSASASLNDGATTVTTSSSSASVSASAATTDQAVPRGESSSCCRDEEEADEEATTAASHCFTMEMDQLWSDIAAAETYPDMISWPGSSCHAIVAAPEEVPTPPSPAWELCADYSLWTIDDEEYYVQQDLVK